MQCLHSSLNGFQKKFSRFRFHKSNVYSTIKWKHVHTVLDHRLCMYSIYFYFYTKERKRMASEYFFYYWRWQDTNRRKYLPCVYIIKGLRVNKNNYCSFLSVSILKLIALFSVSRSSFSVSVFSLLFLSNKPNAIRALSLDSRWLIVSESASSIIVNGFYEKFERPNFLS